MIHLTLQQKKVLNTENLVQTKINKFDNIGDFSIASFSSNIHVNDKVYSKVIGQAIISRVNEAILF